MRAESAVGCFATIVALSMNAGDAHASECLFFIEPVITSQVAVQVFGRFTPFTPIDGAGVILTWEHGQSNPAAAGKTDSQGSLQIAGVPPGLYSLRVTRGGASTDVKVRVVPSSESPPRLIVIGLAGGIACSMHCEVAGTTGPLAKAPKCLTPWPPF